MAKTISLTDRELTKLAVISKLIEGSITAGQAREQLGLSARQVRRLRRKVADEGADGIAHGLRGKPGNKRMAREVAEEASGLLKKYYPDFGPTFAAEKLNDLHGIVLSDEYVRQLMIEHNLWKPKQKKENGQYRSWRPRKEWYGSLEQFDGSYHRWFEDRADERCLLAAIDDATGIVLIEQRLDGTTHIRLREHYLAFTILPARPEKTKERTTALVPRKERKPWKPPANHPWRKPFLASW